jgi:hypothetical protein
MSSDEVKKILVNHFVDRVNFHIRNIQTTIAFLIGILIADNYWNILDRFNLNLTELFIIPIPLLVYFVFKARYWSAMNWRIFKLSKFEIKKKTLADINDYMC